jgi:hypothetical protein
VSPIALFLFTVFIMFAVSSLAAGSSGGAGVSKEATQQLSQEIAQQEQQIVVMKQQRDQLASQGRPTAEWDKKIEENVREMAIARGIQSGIVRGDPKFVQTDELPSWLWVPIDKAQQNPDLLLYKIKTNAYKFSWALIPISVPFLWLLFPFSRRYRIYDHMVFVTYSLSFMSLLVIAAALFNAAGLSLFAALLFFVPPFHMYRQLKDAYDLSRSAAIWRTLLLMMFSAFALALFGSALLGMGLFD